MSRARSDWWEYVKRIIREYPSLLAEEKALHTVSTTVSYTGMPHGSGVSDPTAKAALRELPENKKRRLEAVRDAVKETERYSNGRDRLKIIELVFWKRTHTLAGAALQIPVSERTAVRYHGDFIRAVEKRLDLP